DGRQRLAVGREGHLIDVARRFADSADDPPRGYVPNVHRLISIDRDQGLADGRVDGLTYEEYAFVESNSSHAGEGELREWVTKAVHATREWPLRRSRSRRGDRPLRRLIHEQTPHGDADTGSEHSERQNGNRSQPQSGYQQTPRHELRE